MPYIKTEVRELIQEWPLGEVGCETPGELNYTITQLCLQFIEGDDRYTTYNAVIGALECAKLEMYRRLIAPYEDKKCEENGDVY